LLCAGDQGQAEHWELQQRLWLSSRGGAVLDPAALEAALADSGLAEACGPEVRAALASRLDNNREVALRFALPGAPFSFINGDPLYDEADPAVLIGAAQEALRRPGCRCRSRLYPTLIARATSPSSRSTPPSSPAASPARHRCEGQAHPAAP
jgi:hypothetical protein